MPYKIPDEPDVSEFEYYLVAIPADPLYRQAIKGHYSDLGSVRFWGLEGREAGSEAAAQSWQRAIAETWRLLEMGWPELIVTYIDDIETLLGILRDQMANQVPCCENIAGSGIPGGGSSTDPVPQPVIDAGYATGTSDYEGYSSYKCMAANLFLDTIIQRLRDFAPIVEAGGIVLSLVLAAFGVLTGLTGIAVAGLLIELGAIIAFVEAIKDFSSQDMLDLADDVDANREAIICAIVEADGIEAAIDAFDDEVNALFSGVHSAIIRSMNIRHSMQLWMYGEDGPVELASQLAAAGYSVDDYQCCPDEPPDGYQIVPVAFTSCVGTCTGVAIDGNTITFTNYTNTGGIAALLSTVSNVRGSILLCDLTTPTALEVGGTNCGNQEMLYDNAVLLEGYTFAFSHADHQTAFTDYMAAHTPNANTGVTCCTGVARLAMKNNGGGPMSGTIQAYLILDA